MLGDRLREQASRVEQLEEENSELVAELGSIRRLRDGDNSAPQGDARQAETVDFNEYQRIKAMLAKSDEDYAKVVFARQVLESKLRYYKVMTKQWREYTEKWILKYPKKQLKSFGTPEILPTKSVGDPRSSSAPAPPSIPNCVTPVSDNSRSISPCPGADDARLYKSSPHSHSGRPKLLSDRILATQRAISNVRKVSSGDITEASDESPPRQANHPMNRGNNSIKDCSPDIKRKELGDDQGDESPIIVLERSLKRKGPASKHEDAKPSTALPKNEPLSSSPVPTPASLRMGGPSDSLDLDDIGGHIHTPRKRQKMEQLRVQSSLMLSKVNKDSRKVLDDMNQRSCVETSAIKGGTSQQIAAVDGPPSLHSLELRKDGGEYNDEEGQRQLRKAFFRNQQQAHNKRVHERLDGTRRTSNNSNTYSRRLMDASLPEQSHPTLPKTPAMNALAIRATEDPPKTRAPQGRRETESRRADPTDTAAPSILQPMDPNAHVLPRTNSKPANQKPLHLLSGHDRGAAYVAALAEDGDNSPSTSNKPKAKKSDSMVSFEKASKVPDPHHRLGTLLSGPSTPRSLLGSNVHNLVSPRRLTSSGKRDDGHVYIGNTKAPAKLSPLPAKRSIPESGAEKTTNSKQYGNDNPLMDKGNKPAQSTVDASIAKPSSHRPPSVDPPADDQPEHEPLRARPLDRLRIENFKLNPAHGDYAYHESIRKHDEKQMASGCTDRNCLRCKDMRKFIENSGYTNVPGQKNTEETDRRLIEDYLGDGDNSRRRVEKMSTEERKQILLQAKTKQFADKFGKHRSHFGRAPSPVDFWNTDFPSTQEHERNREAARLREREKVEEMYWEASRKGGRYVFADE